MLRGCGDASPVMEVPERFYGSPTEGSQQLSEVVEVQLFAAVGGETVRWFSSEVNLQVLVIVLEFINPPAVKQ